MLKILEKYLQMLNIDYVVNIVHPAEFFFFFFSDREYDCNKHCGVIVEETGKACTRSLTCKVCNLLINLR